MFTEGMIESIDTRAGFNSRRTIILTVFTFACLIAVSAWTASLFAKEFRLETDDFALSLAAPTEVSPEAPEKRTVKSPKAESRTGRTTVPELYGPLGKDVPENTSGKSGVWDASKFDAGTISTGPLNLGGGGSETGGGLGSGGDSGDGDGGGVPPVIEPKKPKPMVTLGVINARAVDLVKPRYSEVAKRMRLVGEVNVDVTIDENGKVVSARATSGHPFLRDSAERAAMQSVFTPTLLSNQPVKATGTIIYRFTF